MPEKGLFCGINQPSDSANLTEMEKAFTSYRVP